jgi:hypothetical protein
VTNVFVSSTFIDLKEHRVAVRDGIRRLGAIDISMENLGAREQRPKQECLRLIREDSNIFVGIYAHRYGFIPDGDVVSITESEYDAATLANLPRFIYIIDEDHPWRLSHIDDGDNKTHLERFKSSLQKHMWKPFTTADQLAAGVVADVGYHLAIRNSTRVGPGIDVPDIGLDPIRGPAAESSDEWNAKRNDIYNRSRGIFIAHVIEPSKTPDQKFEVFIYLIRHKSQDLTDVRVAEFLLGPSWENRVFPAVAQNGFIGISTAAYGTFLCLCRLTFKDGYQAYVHRYIDFELQRQGG